MKTVKMQNGKINFVILSIYVDDILVFSNDVVMSEDEKRAIGIKFNILGKLIKRDSRTISQSKEIQHD